MGGGQVAPPGGYPSYSVPPGGGVIGVPPTVPPQPGQGAGTPGPVVAGVPGASGAPSAGAPSAGASNASGSPGSSAVPSFGSPSDSGSSLQPGASATVGSFGPTPV